MKLREMAVYAISMAVCICSVPLPTYAEENHIINVTENSICDMDSKAEHIVVESPAEVSEQVADLDTEMFSTCRIVVWDDMLDSDYGADTVISCPKFNEYVLQYSTPEEAQHAYELLRQTYNEQDCWPDRLYSVENMVMEYTPFSWGVSEMGMDNLKNSECFKSLGDAGTAAVAIIDTGCNTGHEAFNGRISEDSYNFADGNSQIYDEDGHGTSVAGIVADSTPDNVKLLILQICNKDGYASSLLFANAMLYAVEKAADVVNMSIVVKSSTDTEWDNALERVYSSNIPFVSGSGNDNKDVSGYYPAYSKYTYAVAAVDGKRNKCSFSNYGSGIDFCAPGSSLKVANVDGGYSTSGGTSLSAPYISAAVSYIKILHPDYSVTDVYEKLKSYSVDLGEEGKDELYGWGLPVLDSYISDELAESSHIHNWKETAGREADCSGGYVKYKCQCGEEKTRTLAAISEHNWGEAVTQEDGLYLYTCSVCKKAVQAPSECGIGMSWSLKNGVLYISGKGLMSDYEVGSFPWNFLNDKIEKVVIRKGIKEVADGAFAYCDNLTEFKVQDGNAYYRNGSGMALYTADGKEIAAVAAGYPLGKGYTVGWGAAVSAIHPYAFAGCKKVNRFEMKADKIRIGEYAFAGCTSLENINIWGKVSHVGKNAFHGVTAKVCCNFGEPASGKDYGGSLTWSFHIWDNGTVTSMPSYSQKGVKTFKCTNCGAEKTESVAMKVLAVPKITSISDTSAGIRIRWKKVTGALGYYVYRNGKKVGTVTDENTLMYTDSGAKGNGVEYRYKICAFAGENKSSLSAQKALYHLSDVKVYKAVQSSGKGIALSWKKNVKASGYQVKYSLGSSVKYVTVAGGSKAKRIIRGLSAGKVYKVYIRAYKNVAGKKYYSCWSRGQKVKVK